MAENRDENGGGGRDPGTGRFTVGNKGGGRRPMDPEVLAKLTAATPKAADRLIEALDANAGGVPDYDMRIKAANAILDRVYGKSTQPVSDPDGQALGSPIAALLERLVG